MNAPTQDVSARAEANHLRPRCPSCGADYPPGSRFCAEDGASLSLPPRPRRSTLHAFEPLCLAETLPASTPPAHSRESSESAPAAAAGYAERQTPSLLAGRYLTLRTLGDGSQGAVLLVHDIQTGRALALKRFRSDVDLARCREELQAAARIEDHAHIVKIHDLHRDPDTQAPFMTMEYLAGETLEARLDREELPLDEAVSILHQASLGLCELHDKLLVHRDIKPANIMLVPTVSGIKVKLLDLGITKSLMPGSKALTQPGWVLGTFDYAAPEQLRGDAVTPAFDIYGLGVVAHRLLHGHLPSEPPPDHFVAAPMPADLRQLVTRMLDAEPTRRPRHDELAAALHATARKLREAAPAQHARAVRELGEPDSDVPHGLSRSAPWLRLVVAALAVTATLFTLFAPVLDNADTSAPPKQPQAALTRTRAPLLTRSCPSSSIANAWRCF